MPFFSSQILFSYFSSFFCISVLLIASNLFKPLLVYRLSLTIIGCMPCPQNACWQDHPSKVHVTGWQCKSNIGRQLSLRNRKCLSKVFHGRIIRFSSLSLFLIQGMYRFVQRTSNDILRNGYTESISCKKCISIGMYRCYRGQYKTGYTWLVLFLFSQGGWKKKSNRILHEHKRGGYRNLHHQGILFWQRGLSAARIHWSVLQLIGCKPLIEEGFPVGSFDESWSDNQLLMNREG